MISLYGLKNCDSCTKARRWAKDQGLDFQFYDLRADPPHAEKIQNWIEAVGLEKLINRRGTSYRALSDADKANLEDERLAVSIILAQSSVMKRPIIEYGGAVFVGFTPEVQAALTGAGS